MAGVSGAIKSALDFILQGFEPREDDPDALFEELGSEMGVEDYPTDKNLALEPMYATQPKNRESAKVVI